MTTRTERTKENTMTAKLHRCSCPVPGCAWFVYASPGNAKGRMGRHQRTEHPEEANA